MNNNDNISIKDNNSQILSILPKEWIEPLAIIARIKGYDGIDDYVLELIRSRLEMFTDTRDELDDESFQQYMQDIPGITTTEQEEEEEDESTTAKTVEEGFEEIKITLKLKKNVAEVLRIFARYYIGDRAKDFDKFITEEVNKIVPTLSSMTLPKFPDGLQQHIQKLLEDDDSR